MEFLLFLTILVIHNTQGRALPMNSDELQSLPNISGQKSNSGTEFKFPTTVSPSLSVTIQGTLNAVDQRFTVILPVADNENSDCKLVYDFAKEMLTSTPTRISDYSSTEYELNLEKREVVKFTLMLTPKVYLENNAEFEMVFEGNGMGPSSLLTCDIPNFKSVQSIIFKEGFKEINSLSFNFTGSNV